MERVIKNKIRIKYIVKCALMHSVSIYCIEFRRRCTEGRKSEVGIRLRMNDAVI